MTDVQPSLEVRPPLIRHAKRESWGRGLILWEREGKRCCQFEDGEARVFSENYFDLLVPARRPNAPGLPDPRVRQRLRVQAIENGHELQTRVGTHGVRAPAPTPSIEDRIVVFTELYPNGFMDETWIHESRTRETGRLLKRLRDPAIELAGKLLAADALNDCVERGAPGEVIDRLRDVLSRTDLVTKKHLAVLDNLPASTDLAQAMISFLHDLRRGDLATMLRLRVVLARFDRKKIAWPLLTAPRALLHPSDHMCVRPSSIRTQAKYSMPTFKLGSDPNPADYARALEVTMHVRRQLTQAELVPRDLFDVTRFMRVTLSSKMKERLFLEMAKRRGTAC